MGRVEPEMGDDTPSWYLADQSYNTGPRVAIGKPQSKRLSLSNPDDNIGSAVRLCGSVGGRKYRTTQAELGQGTREDEDLSRQARAAE